MSIMIHHCHVSIASSVFGVPWIPWIEIVRHDMNWNDKRVRLGKSFASEEFSEYRPATDRENSFNDQRQRSSYHRLQVDLRGIS